MKVDKDKIIPRIKLNLTRHSDGDPGQGGQGGEGNPNGGEKTFTQEDLDNIVKGRVSDTKKATEKAILESLGVENLDDVKAIIKAKKEADEKNKTELEKLQDQVNNLSKEKETAESKANMTLKIADFKVKAIAKGLDAKQVEAALKLANLGTLTIKDDASIEGTEKLVEDLIKEYPFLKGTTNNDVGGGAGGNPGDGDGKGGKSSLGKRLAELKKKQRTTSEKAQNHYFK